RQRPAPVRARAGGGARLLAPGSARRGSFELPLVQRVQAAVIDLFQCRLHGLVVAAAELVEALDVARVDVPAVAHGARGGLETAVQYFRPGRLRQVEIRPRDFDGRGGRGERVAGAEA